MLPQRNVDHHARGKRLKQCTQAVDRKRLRHREYGFYFELMVRGRRTHARDVGNQLLDADTACGQIGRQILHDARTIRPAQFERDAAPARCHRHRIAACDHHTQPGRFKAAQRSRKRIRVALSDIEMHHAGELAAQARHAAAGPIGAETARPFRKHVDDTRPVSTDGRHDERRERPVGLLGQLDAAADDRRPGRIAFVLGPSRQ